MTQAPRQSPVQFRPGPLQAELEARGEPNEIGKRDLGRYYTLLRRELAGVQLSEPEACLLVDALNGTLLDEHTVSLLWAELDDAILQDHLHEKWSLPGEQAGALVARLRSLSPGQAMAVYDAVERFWRDPNPLRERLRAVGLVCDRSDGHAS